VNRFRLGTTENSDALEALADDPAALSRLVGLNQLDLELYDHARSLAFGESVAESLALRGEGGEGAEAAGRRLARILARHHSSAGWLNDAAAGVMGPGREGVVGKEGHNGVCKGYGNMTLSRCRRYLLESVEWCQALTYKARACYLHDINAPDFRVRRGVEKRVTHIKRRMDMAGEKHVRTRSFPLPPALNSQLGRSWGMLRVI
jgi:hypothetical protein